MARRNRKIDSVNNPEINNDKSFRRSVMNINNLIGQANLSLYGTDRTSDVDTLNAKFQELLTNELGDMTNRSEGDITSFLNQVVSSDNKTAASDELLSNQFIAMTGDDYSTMQSFIYDAYRNRLLEQSDLHEVSSQLIELSEAILITRDAIISADVVEGRMSRTLDFDNIDDDDVEDNVAIVEAMEKRFKLLEKIKNFIIPKTLEYGEYYVYVVPYARLFSDFQKQKDNMYGYGRRFTESTIMESFDESAPTRNKKGATPSEDNLEYFLESCYGKYTEQDRTRYTHTESEKAAYESKKIPYEE